MKISLSIIGICLCITLSHAQGEFKLNEDYSIAKGGTLFLNTEDADVTITGTDRDDVGVSVHRVVTGKHYANRKFDFKVEEKDGNLHVKEMMEKKKMNISVYVNSNVTYTVDIEVPKGVNLDIRGEDDNYNIANIEGTLELISEDGDVLLKKIVGEKIDVTLEDGDVNVHNSSAAIQLEMEDGNFMSKDSELIELDIFIEDGNVDLHGGMVGDCKIKSSDGDINIASAFKTKSVIDIRTEDGDVDINSSGEGGTFTVSMDDGDVSFSRNSLELESKSKHRHVYNTIDKGTVEVKISVEDGDVDLNHSTK